jgi:hypothetical protein
MKRHLTKISCEILMDLFDDDIHYVLHLGCLLRRTSEVKSRIKVYSDCEGGGDPLLAPQIVCQFARVLQPEQK